MAGVTALLSEITARMGNRSDIAARGLVWLNDMRNPVRVLDDETAEVGLTQGQICLVDVAMLPVIGRYRWHARLSRGRWYAYTGVAVPGQSWRRSLAMHSVIASALDATLTVDHANRNGLDNRRANLRPASAREQAGNRAASTLNSSGYKGVSHNPRPGRRKHWHAYIRDHGKLRGLGYFATAEEAARAYNDAAPHVFGPFAKLNEVA